jgi:Lanthionine synthetase C-like protein
LLPVPSGDASPLLWRPQEHEAATRRPWHPELVRDEIGSITADTLAFQRDGVWPGHPLDDLNADEFLCSLYLGAAGVIWALWKLDASFDPSAAISAALERYRAAPDFGAEAHRPSLWMGETGLLVVAERIGSPAADRDRLRTLIVDNRAHPTWELMWGSPGTMLAARACGFHEEWRQSAELLYAEWDESTDVWTQDLYGRVAHYLGPPHGFAGNVHALRGCVDEVVLRERVTRLLTRTAGRDGGLINWPPRRDDSFTDPRIRVQWCHGAPGIVATLGDLMPLEMAIGGGELTWRAGPLRKGPGLCHGTAGNGFAFLRLYALTGDTRWLERARRFAMHAIEQVHGERAALGRGRYTLWTGHLGVALYLSACLDGDAAFPTIDSF